ncbi:MAG: hypothetical protein AAF654_04745 [Myxococcota bacterium]
MFALVALHLAASAPLTTPSSPATTLAMNVTELLAARTDRLALDFDPSLEPPAADSLRDAFARAGLFTLDVNAKHRAMFRRDSDDNVTVVVFDGERPLGASTAEWPRGPSARELKGRLRDQRLTLRRASQLDLENVQTDFPSGFDPYLNTNAQRGPEAGFRAPSVAEGSWEVVDGEGNILDDISLAQRLGDERLEAQLSERRARRRRAWSWGFGGAAVVGIGAGAAIALTADDDSDTRDWGLSLVGAGLAAGVMALFNETADAQHLLSVEQAAELVRVHNERLADRQRSESQ